MEVSGQNGFKCDEEEKALKSLLDAFGSAFSLEEIASAYRKASRNPDMAGEILYDLKRSSSTSTRCSWKEARVEESSESSVDFSLENSCQERRNYRSLKPKVRPVSVGTVSSVLGKGYVRSVPLTNGSNRTTKPMKLDANVVPMSAVWGDDDCKPNIPKHNQLHQDMEDFLFKMLGDGFQLDRNVIREVLDSCGYDMQKSMGKLLDGSFMTLDKRTNVAGESSDGFTEVNPKSEVLSSERKFQRANYHRSERSRFPNKGVESHGQRKEREDLQKEVLTALFNACESSAESPRRTARDVSKLSPYGQVIHEPPEDSIEDFRANVKYSELKNLNEGADEDDDYQNLRKAVKEYRTTMNEYYKAAVDAFAKGEHARAEKLLDQGQFFLKKAREADEESNKMIVETRTMEAEEMLLDLHDHGPKEAIRLLKCHLSSLSGIPSIEYLKVIIGANDQNISKRSRRKLVMKLLERESIQWTEGEVAGTILIRLNSVERKGLSFINK